MIPIDQLRYVRLGTRDMEASIDFAARILGLQQVDRSDQAVYFRSDFRDHTLAFFPGDPSERCVGLEIHGEAQWESALAELARREIDVTIGASEECAARKVRAFAGFRDPGGNAIELVLRPLHSGWRYFPARDAGIVGLSGVALGASDVPSCETFWTTLFNGRVSDWVGDAAFLRFDNAHHRLAYYPSNARGILAVEFAVENVDLLMQNSYFLQSSQVRIVHGPGRRPTSNQIFVTFAGPEETLFSFVTEGDEIADEKAHRPRQFPRRQSSFCAWGSESEVPEFR
ncbi:VOC family protein [Bradyrhizobium sp. NP1]|uniref:VOC family protein n=1 Tax=Bradyrhizobium sp. NP1 TaxID=3049772 RepID=UPI0025A6365F|nr:VOC family protein [Bradyrhizobium sp. NP1]WJR77124.1 VOC family protein [Bradyrhizobium sp. NP1]